MKIVGARGHLHKVHSRRADGDYGQRGVVGVVEGAEVSGQAGSTTTVHSSFTTAPCQERGRQQHDRRAYSLSVVVGPAGRRADDAYNSTLASVEGSEPLEMKPGATITTGWYSGRRDAFFGVKF
jgi:hypothetical protein